MCQVLGLFRTALVSHTNVELINKRTILTCVRLSARDKKSALCPALVSPAWTGLDPSGTANNCPTKGIRTPPSRKTSVDTPTVSGNELCTAPYAVQPTSTRPALLDFALNTAFVLLCNHSFLLRDVQIQLRSYQRVARSIEMPPHHTVRVALLAFCRADNSMH